ncbi:hypothetical protein [Blastopirellula sediminis]|uniref:hypothetical protein n=1 Tax=Blastopirellula sediminis TaxID=2894196 RepID=UPI001E5D0ED3|nr:hypothetical protein [Blastopirellula sediminis]
MGLLLAFSGWSTPATAQLASVKQEDFKIEFPDMGISLPGIAGFTPRDGEAIYDSEDGYALIGGMRFERPLAKVKKELSAKSLGKIGIRVRSEEKMELLGRECYRINTEQTSGDVLYTKIFLLFGTEEQTYVTFALFPKKEMTKYESSLLDCMKSIELIPVKYPSLAELAYTIDRVPGLEKTEISSRDRSLHLSRAHLTDEDPLARFSVSYYPNAEPIKDLRAFSIKSEGTGFTRLGKIRSENFTTVDGLDGFEFVAEREDGLTPWKVTGYRLTLQLKPKGYVEIFGTVPRDEADQWMARFRDAAHSFRMKKDGDK